MRKITRLALLLLLMVASVFAMTACDEPDATVVSAEISVEESGMPQLLYVVGEELDLSNGVLTVKNGADVQEIPLNDAGISVTGYDKTKLGEQTLTITYNGRTTQITVTVVERMQVIEFATDYLEGDKFDNSKGRLKITRDDGSHYTVVLNDGGVEITGFDGSKVGEQTLTAKYTGNDASFECKFTVNVHAVESVEFHTPKKVSYNSHETGLDLAEGYFTLSGKGGALTKTVNLTEDMISGFDLTAVNAENSPLTQKLTATYNGKGYEFDVKLVYTNISLFQKECAAFADLDWTGDEIPEYSAELAEKALQMMEVYLDLSKADRTYIDMAQALSVARVALTYGLELIEPEIIAMEGAFIYGDGLMFTCENREGVEAAIEILENEDGDLYRVTPVLVGMTEVLADELIMGDMYFGEVALLPVEMYEELLDMFEHMLDVHDALLEIPEDWKTVGVEVYADEIESFYNEIFSSDYVDSLAEIYSYVAEWRTAGDAFDILYHYYYAKSDIESLSSLAKVNLPTSLSLIAYHATEVLSEIDLISNYYRSDTTLLLYHYQTAVRLVAELKASDDEMAKRLYDILPVNSLLGIDESVSFSFDDLMAYIRTMEGGYYQFCGGLLGIEAYHDFLDAYIALIDKILDAEMSYEDIIFENIQEYEVELQALFGMFAQMSPTQQYYLLNSLNPFYAQNMPPLVFDEHPDELKDLQPCFFVKLMHEYYRGKLGDNAAAYDNLVVAIEIYAQRISYQNWYAEFTARMDNVKTAYSKMNADEKALFDSLLGVTYNNYVAIRTEYVDATEYTDLGEWADEFKALGDAITNIEIAAAYIQNGTPVYSLFFSAYERAQVLADYIVNNAPAEILEVYFYEDRFGLDENGEKPEGAVLMSYEYLLTTYRTMYINYLLTNPDIGSFYDGYVASQLPAFLEQVYDMYWTCILNTDENPLHYNKAQVMATLKAFRELTLDEQILFIRLEGSASVYYLALDEFLTENFTDNAAAVANQLLNLEQQYIMYSFYVSLDVETDDVVAEMETVLTEMKAAYEALSAEDKASFADFEEMYNYYVTLCEQAIAG